jgi:hypothetical protein
MAGVGLATGAGAAGGLETLLARMRAEEALANQGRMIDLDEFETRQLAGHRQATLAENQRQFDTQAPLRQAQTTNLTASARESNVDADLSTERVSALRGLRGTLPGAQPQGGIVAGTPGAGTQTGAGGEVGGLNSPFGRLRLSLAGITPSQVFPNDSGEDETYDAFARKIGKNSRFDLTFDERMEAERQSPRFQQGQSRIQISQDNLGVRRQESDLRKRKMELDIQASEMKMSEIPVLQRQMAIAEFRNRIQNDITSKSTWSQWLAGDSVQDVPAQINQIRDEVLAKYLPSPGRGQPGGRTNPEPATAGADLDAILMERRRQRGR